VRYHPLMSSITRTNYSGQCSIIPLYPVLQTIAASAVSSTYVQYYKLQQPVQSSPYIQYYKLQWPVQYHPLISSITNYSGQCSIIPLYPVLQTIAASAVSSSPYVQYYKLQQPVQSSPYIQYYKLQWPVQYHPLISNVTNYSSQCSIIIPLCPVLQTTAASAVSSPYIQYYKLQWPVQCHPLVSSIAKHHFCLICSFYQRV